MKKTVLFGIILFIVFSCEIWDNLINRKSLEVVYKDISVKNPANVSIIFKVNDENSYPLPYLTKEQFEIFEDEVLISEFEAEREIQPRPEKFKFNILLLIDLSGSVLDSSFNKLKTASNSLINLIMPNEISSDYGTILMSIKWFDGEKNLHNLIDYTDETGSLTTSIEDINPEISTDNSTNLYGSLIQGISNLEDKLNFYAQNEIISAGAIITFTDGTDQANWYSLDEVNKAISTMNSSIALYSIGLGGEIDKDVLQAFGINGSVQAENLNDLSPKFEEVAKFVKDEANSYYILEYCSPKRAGDHELKITMTNNDLEGNLIVSFDATGFEGGCILGSDSN